MGRRNWDRPAFHRQGRQTEALNGGDIPVEFFRSPRAPRQSKADLRTETDKLVAEFEAKKPKAESKTKEPASPSPDERPPWE